MVEGSSSTEAWQPVLFDSEELAKDHMEGANTASYNCLGPFALEVTPDDEIIAAFHRLLKEFMPGAMIVKVEEPS